MKATILVLGIAAIVAVVWWLIRTDVFADAATILGIHEPFRSLVAMRLAPISVIFAMGLALDYVLRRLGRAPS